MGRLAYGTNKSLKVTAETMGAKVVGSVLTGLAAKAPQQALPRGTRRKIKALARRLAA
jgi:hypothetical protein